MLLPVPTVFEEDGRIDIKLMEELVDYYVDSGVNALFVGGSFGQGPAMSIEERKQLADVVVKRANHRLPVIVHAGTADPFTTIDLGRHCLKAGADAYLAKPATASDIMMASAACCRTMCT